MFNAHEANICLRFLFLWWEEADVTVNPAFPKQESCGEGVG